MACIQYGYGVFINPLAEAFGCSLTAIGAWSSFVSVGVLAAGPIVGRLADRFGVRPVVLTAIPSVALVLAGVAAIHHGVWLLWLAALATGVLGVATGALTYARAVNGWFFLRRGTALGLMSAGVGLSAIFGPRLVQSVVDAWGWRSGFLFLGACALLPLPLLVLWLREPRDKIGRQAPSPETGYSLKQTVRLPLFWLMGSASFLWLSCFGGVFFLIPVSKLCRGLGRAEAATDAGLLGITTTIGRITTGAVMDRLPLPARLAPRSVFILEAAAFAALALFQARYVAWAILAIGFAHGTENVGFSYCIARYFGMKSYSTIAGVLGFFSGVGLALAPVVFSSLKGITGTYRVPFLTSAAMAAGAGVLFVLVGRHRPADAEVWSESRC